MKVEFWVGIVILLSLVFVSFIYALVCGSIIDAFYMLGLLGAAAGKVAELDGRMSP